MKLEVQISPAARTLLITGTLAPGSLKWWSTSADRTLGATRRRRCWRARSSAGQRFGRENATPGAVLAAPNETAHNQKQCGVVAQGVREVNTRFGGAAQGAQIKSSACKHEKRTIFAEKANRIELPNWPAANPRQQVRFAC